MHAELRILAAQRIHSNAVRLDTVSAGTLCAIVNWTATMDRMKSAAPTQNVQPKHLNAIKAVHAFHGPPFVMANHNVHTVKTNLTVI